MPWYQGSFHCHTTNSDGKSAPEEVARFYRAIGMSFAAIADHNHLTRIEEYGSVPADDFIGIPCCEYSGAKRCHVVGIDVSCTVAPEGDQDGLELKEILQEGIDRIRKAGGIPILCHPCWYWTYDQETIKRLERVTHFEVFNGHHACNSYPIAGVSYPEEIWDRLLSSGVRLFGAANDDAHYYGDIQTRGKVLRRIPFGGSGWNVVKAARLDRQSVREAFDAGHFYASTGIRLTEYRVADGNISVEVEEVNDVRVAIEFVGRGGRSLARTVGLEASYRIRGDEKYVRIRLADTAGCFAFTQPVFVDTIAQDGAWTLEP
jgi:hypothetical protein